MPLMRARPPWPPAPQWESRPAPWLRPLAGPLLHTPPGPGPAWAAPLGQGPGRRWRPGALLGMTGVTPRFSMAPGLHQLQTVPEKPLARLLTRRSMMPRPHPGEGSPAPTAWVTIRFLWSCLHSSWVMITSLNFPKPVVIHTPRQPRPPAYPPPGGTPKCAAWPQGQGPPGRCPGKLPPAPPRSVYGL